MRAIYKFHLEMTDQQEVMIPRGGQILTAQMQGDQLCLWALVEPGVSSSYRSIRIVGTGNPIEYLGKLKHISTVHDGRFMWHVFEET